MRLALALLTAVVLVVVAPASASTRPKVLVSECGQPGTQKPSSYVILCGDGGLRGADLRWTHWGAKVAVAHGRQVSTSCDPDCATGHLVKVALTVRLSGRKPCPRRGIVRYYRKATLIVSGHARSYALACPSGPIR